MKIKNLRLENIGPYQGINNLEFDLEKPSKNIILIGGKNGAGKTTIFTAIKIAMYGAKAFGYENLNQKYFDEITKLINSSLFLKSSIVASIELSILIDDGKDDNVFRICRSWTLKGISLKEKCQIYKNGCLIIGDEFLNFIAYLDNIVPANLFNFYFFDGEKIGDYFLSNETNQNFKQAFLILCGLDSISIMTKNFERIYTDSVPESTKCKTFNELKKGLSVLRNENDRIENELIENNNLSITLLSQKESLENDYNLSGGVTINAWIEINKKILQEENYRDVRYKRLREIVVSELPFVILKKQIVNLQKKLASEKKHIEKDVIKSFFNKSQVIDFIVNFNSCDKNYANEFVDKLLKSVLDNVETDINNINLNLSYESEQRINTIIMSKLNYDKSEISKLYAEIEKSRLASTKAKKKLKNSSLENIDKFMVELNSITQKIIHNKNENEKLTLQKYEISQLIAVKEKEVEKAKKTYEEEIKANSINSIAGRALLVFNDIEKQLIAKYSQALELKFIDNFTKIINKKKFLDGIFVDKKLNVYPYKNIQYDIGELKQIVNNYGVKYLIDTVGVLNESFVDKALSSTEKVVVLPVIIKTPFSQGEKQVYIMSLYISLLQIAKVNVPFVIDTPFARIDSEHREKIIKEFFKKIKSQVIILSTDEEIVGDLKYKIDENISNTYLLKSFSHGLTSIVPNCYFGEKNDI